VSFVTCCACQDIYISHVFVERGGLMIGGSDVHIYYFQENAEQKTFARELWERIRRECEF
jgi:hypothetical protein